MSVPTISSLDGNSFPAMGGTALRITGTGFRLPTPPPTTGVVPPRPVPVRVLFGTIEARAVLVLSSTLLVVITPEVNLVDAADRPVSNLVVNLTVQNIDDSGVLIPTETVTAANAITFVRPDLSSSRQSDLLLVTREVIRRLVSAVTKNVVMTQSMDYGTGDSAPYTVVSETPGLAIASMSLERSENQDSNVDSIRSVGTSGSYIIQSGKYVHIVYDIITYANNPHSAVNLLNALHTWVERTGRISVPVDSSDPTKGSSTYEISIPPGSDAMGGREYGPALNSNLNSFSTMLRVHDVFIGTLPGVDFDAVKGYTAVVDEVVAEVVRLSPMTVD